MNKLLLITVLAGTGMLGTINSANAQVAGSSTTVGVAITESNTIASGWSVKRTVLGSTIYNDQGEKIGKVKDLIIAPDRKVSYAIIAAGGFVGIGSHDVAISVSLLEEQSGRLVMPGATKDSIRALPHFEYASSTSRRDAFISKTELDLTRARDEIAVLHKKADAGSVDFKTALEAKINASQVELDSTTARLSTLKNAGVDHWREFEASVTNANRRLRKSLTKASV